MGTWYRLYLTAAEQEQLRKLISKRKGAAKQVVRSQLLLAIAENGLNKTDQEAAALYGTTTRSIERLRKRCCEDGLELALEGKKREVFKEKKLTGEVEAKLTMLACSEAPAGYERWTLQLLADKLVALNYIDSISHTSVGNLLKKMRLSPGEKRCG
jgi:transposase